ncbi:MAG: MBL fold metallo-hydrolase [Ilumatobacteraceae bacterium]
MFHGVRGSTPCHGDDVARYGGNTSCVSVRIPGEAPLFFDIGTGAQYLARELAHDGSFRGTCLLSHLHWDHTQGLPFFTPLLRDGAHLDIHAPVQDDGRTIAEVFGEVIRPPLFPITLAELPGSLGFHETVDGTFAVGAATVTARTVPHIGPTLGYRVEWNGLSVVYLSDHQQPVDGSFAITDSVRDLVTGADVLIHDSQYTPHEFAAKSTWGHCTIDFAVWLAHECSVGTLVLFHHDPGRTDDALDAIVAEVAAGAAQRGMRVVAAHEGLTVDVAAMAAGR